jgi:hypothetical protein
MYISYNKVCKLYEYLPKPIVNAGSAPKLTNNCLKSQSSGPNASKLSYSSGTYISKQKVSEGMHI